MRIVIENLPKDVSEEEIREALKPFAQVGAIKLIKEGSAPTTLDRGGESRAGRRAGQAHQRTFLQRTEARCLGAAVERVSTPKGEQWIRRS